MYNNSVETLIKEKFLGEWALEQLAFSSLLKAAKDVERALLFFMAFSKIWSMSFPNSTNIVIDTVSTIIWFTRIARK